MVFYIDIVNILQNKHKNNIMQTLTTNQIQNIKFKTVNTYTGGDVAGYRNEKTIEFGKWIISRDGQYNKDGVFIHWAGDWNITKNGESYGSTKTLKEAKNYIKMWLTHNPSDY